jgi:hypothetical protein
MQATLAFLTATDVYAVVGETEFTRFKRIAE